MQRIKQQQQQQQQCLEVPADVADATVSEADRPRPARDADDRYAGDDRQPEPEERVDLLGEQVDGQDALDGVPVDGAQLADVEVAERHARKPANDDAVDGRRPSSGRAHATAASQVHQHLMSNDEGSCRHMRLDQLTACISDMQIRVQVYVRI